MRPTRFLFAASFALAAISFPHRTDAGGYSSSYSRGYSHGQVVNGFTYNSGGYWTRGGLKYTPSYYGGQQYWKVSNYAQAKPIDYDALKSRLLGIAEDRNRSELYLREKSVKHNELLELAEKLGIHDFHIQGFGQGVNYSKGSAYSYSTKGRAAVNPQYNPYITGQSTVYQNGMALGGLKELVVSTYGSYDVAATQDGNRRLALTAMEGGLELSRENLALDSQVQALFHEATRSLAAVSEVEAAAEQTRANAQLIEANRSTIQASKPKDSARIEIRERVQSQSGGGREVRSSAAPGHVPVRPDASSDVTLLEQLFIGAQSKCGRCHNAEKADGGLDLAQWGTWDAQRFNEVKDGIFDRIRTVSPDKRMPPIQSGIELTPAEFAAIVQAVQ